MAVEGVGRGRREFHRDCSRSHSLARARSCDLLAACLPSCVRPLSAIRWWDGQAPAGNDRISILSSLHRHSMLPRVPRSVPAVTLHPHPALVFCKSLTFRWGVFVLSRLVV